MAEGGRGGEEDDEGGEGQGIEGITMSVYQDGGQKTGGHDACPDGGDRKAGDEDIGEEGGKGGQRGDLSDIIPQEDSFR